jgi:hypothetical protein
MKRIFGIATMWLLIAAVVACGESGASEGAASPTAPPTFGRIAVTPVSTLSFGDR